MRQAASTPAICSCWRRLPIRLTARSTSSARTIVKLSRTTRPHSSTGQGALSGALPFFLVTKCGGTEQHAPDETLKRISRSKNATETFLERPGLEQRCSYFRQDCMGAFRSCRRGARHRSRGNDFRNGCPTPREHYQLPPESLNLTGQSACLYECLAPLLFSYCPRDTVPNFARRVKVSPLYGLTFFRFGNGIFRDRNANLFAAHLILRFSQRMGHAINAGSKLCAEVPRHAQVMRPLAACLRSTWQGRGSPFRCILPRCRERHVETLPVSTPSGFRRRASIPSYAVRP
jgi:hypothetical protein